MRVGTVLVRLQDTTAEIRVRMSVALLIEFVALAERFGLETILGALLDGAVVSLLDRDSAWHPHFRIKLDAIGYGLLVPVFFVASGVRLDLQGLLAQPSALLRVPVFLLALLVVHGLPALRYLSDLGRHATIAAGLLQATSLPFLVTAATIGIQVGTISSVTGAALICAGLLSVVIFPAAALSWLRKHAHPSPSSMLASPSDASAHAEASL
jgi:Kef-type K+ transport system membrane component KefB